MAIVKYTVKENKTLGTHSFYAQAVTYNTLSLEDLAVEICEGMGCNKSMVLGILNRLSEIVNREVVRGHRVNFAGICTFYPQISASLKDVVDKDGKVITPATADKLSIAKAKSSIGCMVNADLVKQFAHDVQWKKVGDDDKTVTPTPTSPSDTGGTDTGGSTGGEQSGTGESGTGESGTGGTDGGDSGTGGND